MTDQLFETPRTAPPALRPAERFGRWVLHRAGITNVWQYDRTELQFGGGRALLRGRNGAGKSKALEVLLPFLLDGDTRSIDAAGRDRTGVMWLMTDGRDPGNHVGYVWLELRLTTEDGEDRFCTLGAGLKASTSTRQSTTWFFMTEDVRVGIDLDLTHEMSVDRLKEQLGADTVTTAAEHRRRVAARLFDLHDEARYGNLLHLLHRLRDPNIGNKIEAGELASVLRDALPPPSDDAMEKAADRFDTLDQVREQLERTQKTAAALTRFLDTYAGYTRTVLRDRSERVVQAAAAHRRTETEARRAEAEAAAAIQAREAAEGEVDRLRDDESTAVQTLESLRDSEAYKQHQNLADRRRTVDVMGQAADAAEQAARGLAAAAEEAAADERRALDRAEADEAKVHAGRADLVRIAGQAGIDQAVVPVDAAGIPPATAVAEGRRRAAEQVGRLVEATRSAHARADQADDQAARSEEELGRRQAEADRAGERWVDESRAWRTLVRQWPGVDLSAVEGRPPDWGALHRALGEAAATTEELDEAEALARSLLGPLQDSTRRAESTARSALTAARDALDAKQAELAALEAEEEARPPASRFVADGRDGRAGAPFYETVDVVAGLSGPDQAGLEAALEASGLLDAWVADDGIVLHPSTRDVILRADGPALPEGLPTLADVLVAAHPHVQQLLGTVGLGDQGTLPWMSIDGRWSLGPVRGAWSKPEMEYLGAGARRATRRRRLDELERQRVDLQVAADEAAALLDRAQALRELLDGLPSTFPDARAVRATAAAADAAAAVTGDARSRHETDRRAAEQARTAAVRAASELAHAAGVDSLPVDPESLDVVVRAAGDLARGLRDWAGAWAQAVERRAEAVEATRRRTDRTATAEEASAQAESRRREHRQEITALAALEDAVGASVAEVLAGITTWTDRRDVARREIPAATARAQDLAATAGSRQEVAVAARAAVEKAAGDVAVAGDRLARTAVLPGLAVAALGPEWEWDGRDTVAVARDLRNRVGDGEPVSDQVVLNRLRDLEDGLAGGYDVAIEEDDGVKFFHVTDDTGRQPLPTVAARVVAEATAAGERLAASEREVIERFLLGELGEELRERLLESHDLVQAANRALAGVRSSHGKGAHLDWRVDQEAPPATRRTVELLVTAPRSIDEDAELRDSLMDLIRVQREKDPALGYLDHLRTALDYRWWHRFTVQVVDDARPGWTRALSSRLGLSQGEQRVLSYLALFAAASAHYDGLGDGCPRLLLLDDAFAKVDEPTHGRLLRLLVDLDLDFMLTSERMWGCFPDVPSIEIYEALREPSTPGVALVHYRWDGRTRHLVGL